MKTPDPEGLRQARAQAKAARSARERRQALIKHGLLILASFGMLYPLLWMFASSFKPESHIFSELGLWPSEIVLGNYAAGWTALRVTFATFYWNSIVIAVLSVIGNLMACSLTAFAFARLEFRLKWLWFALMLGTLMLPYHVTLVPQYVLFLKIGWVDTILPLVVPKFLASDAFFIFLMVQFFRGIPRELDEAARMDGCGPWRIYWRIMLPLSTPVLATAAIFSFIWTYDDFLGPLIYLNDINSYTVPLALRAFVDSSGGESLYGELFAMSALSLVPVFIVFLAFQRLIIRGVALGALKR
jgi:multiple sugar transport system permease protein